MELFKTLPVFSVSAVVTSSDSLHDDGVIELDVRQGFAGGVGGELLDVVRAGPAAEDDPLAAELNRQVADPSASPTGHPL